MSTSGYVKRPPSQDEAQFAAVTANGLHRNGSGVKGTSGADKMIAGLVQINPFEDLVDGNVTRASNGSRASTTWAPSGNGNVTVNLDRAASRPAMSGFARAPASPVTRPMPDLMVTGYKRKDESFSSV